MIAEAIKRMAAAALLGGLAVTSHAAVTTLEFQNGNNNFDSHTFAGLAGGAFSLLVEGFKGPVQVGNESNISRTGNGWGVAGAPEGNNLGEDAVNGQETLRFTIFDLNDPTARLSTIFLSGFNSNDSALLQIGGDPAYPVSGLPNPSTLDEFDVGNVLLTEGFTFSVSADGEDSEFRVHSLEFYIPEDNPTPMAIPEPLPIGLSLMGLALVGLVRRHKKAGAAPQG